MSCGRRRPVHRGDGRDPARGSGGDSLWQVWPRPQGLVQMDSADGGGAVRGTDSLEALRSLCCAGPGEGLGVSWPSLSPSSECGN